MDKYRILKQYFAFDRFREGQEKLIDGILGGKDVFGVMPTGSGKSLCFQIPALMIDGITLVISPLISLMKDQVASLNQAGIHAAYLNSSLTPGQYYKALEYAKAGRYPIIYVAPERLETEAFLDFALNSKIAMVAVDEAHCVSQWGQDFRPSYLKIVDFIRRLPKRPIVSAFTATATKEVREDIIDILMLQDPIMVTTGYDRPNLYLSVQTPRDKYATLKTYLEAHPEQCGIVYCLTRKLVDEVSNRLRDDSFSVSRYHAGLSDAERKLNQDDFIYDRRLIMVATNAFGMGIDKSNVRFIIHYNMPGSIEAYYQEIGRCARDQEPGECILYYSGQDVVTNQYFIDHNTENRELDSVTRRMVAERDRERLRKITFYCFTRECLRDYILRYFGEYHSNYCGNCGNCLTQFESTDVTEIAKALIGCVSSSRQRYGVNVILDTVHGANNAKIRQYRMKENLYYGVLAKVPTYRLRQVMNELMLRDFLSVTSDEYSIIKLTENSKKILDEAEPFVMKMAKEQELQEKQQNNKTSKNGKMAGVELSSTEKALFEKLRLFRLGIAREEKVPPYIVFSDKTLIHMCLTRPKTKAEMLSVPGVGIFKFEKYGERFLKCIEENKEESKEESKEKNDCKGNSYLEKSHFDTEEDEIDANEKNRKTYPDNRKPEWDIRSSEEVTSARGDGRIEYSEQEERQNEGYTAEKKSRRGKTEFFMTQELTQKLRYSDRATLSELVGQINELRDAERMKRLTIKSVEDKLTAAGYFDEADISGKKWRTVTQKGKSLGIIPEQRVSQKGNEYFVFYYTEMAQRQIVKWLLNEQDEVFLLE